MSNKEIIRISDSCFVDLRSAELTKSDSSVVSLTKKEFDLIRAFGNHTGATLSKERIFSLVWSEDYGNGITEYGQVRDLVRRLRHRDTALSESITTKRGIGYIFRPLCKESAIAQSCRILSTSDLNMDAMDISSRIMKNDELLYKRLPPACKGHRQQWATMLRIFSDYCRFLVDSGGGIQGNFSLISLSKQQETAMQQGALVDSQIDILECDPLLEKGEHAIYLLNLSVNPGVEVEMYNMLWASLIQLIKDRAKEGIYFSRIYYKALLPEHVPQVIGRGFVFHCRDLIYGNIYVHNMDADTTLRVLDEELAELYRRRKAEKSPEISDSLTYLERLEAENAYLAFFREIDELFRYPRFRPLKPYFFDGMGLPEDESLQKLGIAVAELLRDILQYSNGFLEYLRDHRNCSHDEYVQTIMNSELVRLSMMEYQFTTEKSGSRLRYPKFSAASAMDLISFARIWTDIDRLFLREDVLPIRPYFYEWSDRLPESEMMDRAIAVTIRILTGMKISEERLSRIPSPYVSSYYDYRCKMMEVRLIREVLGRYPFLRDELMW